MQTESAPIPNTRDIFMLAWPLAMNTVMIQGIVVIDAYLVSSLGEEALAAMGLAGALVGLLAGIIFSFSNATQIRIAQAFGSASPKSLKTNFYCGLAINLAVTLLGLLILWIISAPIIDRFAHSESMAEQAKSYLNVFTIVIACQAVVLCLTSHFNGCGHTKMPFYSHLLSLPINIAISIVLIHGLFGFPAPGAYGCGNRQCYRRRDTADLSYHAVLSVGSRLYRRGWLAGGQFYRIIEKAFYILIADCHDIYQRDIGESCLRASLCEYEHISIRGDDLDFPLDSYCRHDWHIVVASNWDFCRAIAG